MAENFEEVKVTVDGDKVKAESDNKKLKSTLLEDLIKNTPKPKKKNYTSVKNRVRPMKEVAVVRMSENGTDISSVSSFGPHLFGRYPLKWLYIMYNSVRDYFFSKDSYAFLRVSLYRDTVKAAALSEPKKLRYKVGELYKNGVVPKDENA